MSFRFGQTSVKNLIGVHPALVGVVNSALELSAQDFAVYDGLRTEEEQAKYLASGKSYTKNSKHLKQSDGFGHAVDLVPFVGGMLKWEWPYIYPIAEAMRQAAKEARVRVKWGGAWAILNDTTDAVEALEKAYTASRVSAGRRAFVDGPHFELA